MGLLTGFDDILRENEPLAHYTNLKLGGPAEYLAEPNSLSQLEKLVRHCHENEIPVRLLGHGSNLLIRDEGVPGLVIRLVHAAFCEITVEGCIISSGGGASLGQLISASVGHGLAGLEPLVGVPGTVGGALHGNVGTHGGDIGQWTTSATVMTRSGEILVRQQDEMHFAYRQSSLDELVVLQGQFRLELHDPDELTRRMQKIWIIQKAKQPLGDQRAGRIFKDPRGMDAADLIEQVGLKAARVGEAVLSDRHANYIIANPGATSRDVLQLIDLIRSRVLEQLEVELETAIGIW